MAKNTFVEETMFKFNYLHLYQNNFWFHIFMFSYLVSNKFEKIILLIIADPQFKVLVVNDIVLT